MKTLKNLVKLALISTIGLSACKTIEEGVIYKTKEYVGKLESSRTFATKWPKPKKTFIVTDSVSFTVRGELPKIESGTWCYVTHDRIKDISGNPQGVTYFTWSGNKKEKKFKVYRRGRSY